MATQEQCAELVSRLRVVGAVCREISRSMPSDSPPASVAILSLLARYGEMRASRLAELLDVDAAYRREAAARTLKKIAPRRFNPAGEAWLPVLHTTRERRHYTALFSNTARAHEQRKTHDWVVLYYDGQEGERQCTVITSEFGRLKGLRIVRGREGECQEFYREHGEPR